MFNSLLEFILYRPYYVQFVVLGFSLFTVLGSHVELHVHVIGELRIAINYKHKIYDNFSHQKR